MGRMDDLLRMLKTSGGSDLHLVACSEPRMRVKGALGPIEGEAPLDDAGVRALMREIVSPEQWSQFESAGDLDFAYGLAGVARFRGNFLMQENGAAAVFRIIPEDILTIEQLGVPPAIESLCELSKGLVLVTGPTGSGKSTTLAAMVDYASTKTAADHIITIEDPAGVRAPGSSSAGAQRSARSRIPRRKFRTRALRAAHSCRTPTSYWSARCATTRR